MFLFSCYTGIPYSDMRLLTNENLSLAEDGTWWIKSSRKKTGVDFEIPLMELPFHIIEKYRDMPLRESFSPCIRFYKGKVVPSIERRRKVEYLLLFEVILLI